MAMKFLKTIDPIKSLKGKLNFLKYENQPILQVLKLANSLSNKQADQDQSQNKKSSLDNISVQQINKLANETELSSQQHKKMLFEAHVHRHANLNLPTGTIYQDLDRHQKKLVLTLLKFSDKLNARQMSYLQYALRRKINTLYPNWDNLHFNPDSPLRKQFAFVPNLSSIQHLYEMKLLPKKDVMTTIASTRPKVEKLQPQPAKAAAAPAPADKGKGKGKEK